MKRNNKIFAYGILMLLVLTPVSYGYGKYWDWEGFDTALGKQLEPGTAGKYIGGLFGKEHFLDTTGSFALVAWLGWMANSAARNFNTHLREYVVINPNMQLDTSSNKFIYKPDPDMLRVMGFFISIAEAFYILSITITGFYLLFVSGSARARAKAKYVLGRLIIGMILVAISPFLLQLLFTFSSSFTDAILEQGALHVVTKEYNGIFWKAFQAQIFLLYPTLANPAKEIAVDRAIERLSTSPIWFEELGPILKGAKVATSPPSLVIYPYFLTVVLLVFTFGFLAFRYLMTMLWAILLPLSIFFTSFELTKNIGRTMMEQTLQWTFFQIFYAITLVALSIGLMILPEGYKGYGILFVGFHSLAMVAIMFFGPWYLSSLIQRLFPP